MTTQPDTDAPPIPEVPEGWHLVKWAGSSMLIARDGTRHPLEDAPSDSPRPPTTPQTEAGLRLLGTAYLEGDAQQEGVNLSDAILAIEREAAAEEVRQCQNRGHLTAKDLHDMQERAAAGALPSVERLADAVHFALGHTGNDDVTACVAGFLDQQYAAAIHDRLAAAPPEASERRTSNSSYMPFPKSPYDE